MTEDEWLTCAVPERLLAQIPETGELRRIRLFVVACCRRIWHLCGNTSRLKVEVSERLADGQASNAERRTAALAKRDSTEMWQAGAAASIAVGTLRPRLVVLGLQHAACAIIDPAL